MKIKIEPARLSGRIKAIESKSDAHRVLIAAALSQEASELTIKNISKDIWATIDSLKALGADFDINETGLIKVSPLWGKEKTNPHIDCGESGTTLRFMLPLAAAVSGDFTVDAGGRLPYRPINPLIQAMNINGVGFSREKIPLKVSGKLRGGFYLLPGHVSSQFVSGLLLTLPILEGDSEIFLTSDLESAAYVAMTEKTLKDFGLVFAKEGRNYKIPGGQKYRVPSNIKIEGDWSNAAYWLAAAALGGKISLEGLSEDSLQSDKAILDVLKNMGVSFKFDQGLLKIEASELKAVEFDASQAPDLVPVVAVLMAAAQGTSLIKNAGRLRLKESDRLQAMADGLTALGINTEVGGDYLKIEGSKEISGGSIRSHNDHRIAMAFAVLASKCKSPLEIEGAEAVTKSYPAFFDDFKALGGIVHGL